MYVKVSGSTRRLLFFSQLSSAEADVRGNPLLTERNGKQSGQIDLIEFFLRRQTASQEGPEMWLVRSGLIKKFQVKRRCSATLSSRHCVPFVSLGIS